MLLKRGILQTFGERTLQIGHRRQRAGSEGKTDNFEEDRGAQYDHNEVSVKISG